MTNEQAPPSDEAAVPAVATPMERGGLRRTWSEFRDAGGGDTSLLGQPIPFVGRRPQLEALYNCVRDALNARQVRVAWVHGGRGLGKSRLFSELERVVAPQKRGVGWYSVHAAQSAAGPPTLAGRILLELVGGAAVMIDPSPWTRVQEQIRGLIGGRHAAEVMLVVAPLLGLRGPQDAEELAPGGREAPTDVAAQFVGGLLRARARNGPFVLRIDGVGAVIDELHIVVTNLEKTLQSVPVAMLVEAESGSPEELPALDLLVEPLPEAPLETLARHLLRELKNRPKDLVRHLVATADGSPERLLDLLRGMIAARELIEKDGSWQWRGRPETRPVSAAALRTDPESDGRSILPDRIARLPDELRLIVEAAAVFGSRFWFGGLLSVLRGTSAVPDETFTDRDRVKLKAWIMQLQSIDVVVFVESSKMSREIEFAFQDGGDAARIAEHTDGTRRQLYARLAAQWLNARPRQDPVGDTAGIAELYEIGGRRRLAAGFYLEAGHAARSVGQIQRAVALYQAGAKLTDTDDADLAADLRTAHGGALLRLSHHGDAEPILLEALRMARCLEDDVRCGIAQLRIAQVARVSGRYEAALRFLEGALKHLRVAGAHRWIADVMDEIGLVHLVQGGSDSYKLALAHFLKALALRRRSEDRRLVARSLCHISRIHMARGHFQDAHDAATESVQICDAIQDRWGAAKSRTVLGEVYAARGKHPLALSTWEVATDMATEVGDASRRLELIVLRAETYITLGRWEDAAALMVDALDVAREINDPELLSGIYRVQAAISLERQALETADLDSSRAVEVARESGARTQVARALLVRGCVLGTRALSETGARSTVIDRKATESFEEALAAFREMGDLVRQAAGLKSFANYLSQRGGGPRLSAVQKRLAEVDSELERVVGNM